MIMRSSACRVALAVTLVTLLLTLAGARSAGAFAAHGRVLSDQDGDGRVSAADVPLGGVTVVFEHDPGFFAADAWVETGTDGSFDLTDATQGLVWVRTPDGYAPGPNWMVVHDDGANLILLLTPRPSSGPLRFVHASDTHCGQVDEASTRAALSQAAGGSPAPAFVLVTGDISQSSERDQLEAFARASRGLGAPIVPLLGNHDWADGGARWREVLGPTMWSFDAGGAHFAVLNGEASAAARLAFLDRDLALTRPGQLRVAAQHFPVTLPYDQVLYDGLVARGVTHLFTGHYHANRHIEYPGLTEHNVQPLVFGGLDGMPAGYQVVTIDGDKVDVREHDVTERPVFELIAPRPDSCIAAAPSEVIVAIADGAREHTLRARIDGGGWQALADRGGWDAALPLAPLAPGDHHVVVELASADRATRTIEADFCVTEMKDPLALPAWPQLGGGPGHQGASDLRLSPPLSMRWARTVGGHVHAPPVLDDAGRLFVSVADYGTGGGGGIVALDAQTGTRRWAVIHGAAVHGSAAVAAGVVVFADVDGELRGVDAATGQERWHVTVDPDHVGGSVSLYAAPVIVGGVAYVGTMYRFVAVDIRSGALRWSTTPSQADFVDMSHATPAAIDGRIIAPLGRTTGLFAYDAASGEIDWSDPDPVALGVTAAPVLDGERIFTVNSATLVSSLALADGTTRWQRQLFERGFDYAFWSWATPALGRGRLVLPTKEAGLIALDVDDGEVAWTFQVGESVVHTEHYAVLAHSVSSPPVITGDVLWSGGDDGVLRAMRASTGELLWQTDLGAPLSGGVVPSQNLLFVAGWDGSVRAMMVDESPTPGGCDIGLASSERLGTVGAWAWLVAAFGLVMVAARSARPRSSCM
jgi:outer membrane protein assembly factor BamB